jgi:hypothetical protein
VKVGDSDMLTSSGDTSWPWPACDSVQNRQIRRSWILSQPIWRRIEAAKAAAPYRHIRIDDPFFRTLSEAQLDEVKNARVIDHERS